MIKGSNSGGAKGSGGNAGKRGSGGRPGTGLPVANLPSKTGRPSGGGRGNAPPRNKG